MDTRTEVNRVLRQLGFHVYSTKPTVNYPGDKICENCGGFGEVQGKDDYYPCRECNGYPGGGKNGK